MKNLNLSASALALMLLLSPACPASAESKFHPEWAPSFWYEEDNFDREHWRFQQEGSFSAGKATSLFVHHARARFYEDGIEAVHEDAFGGGVRRRLGRHQLLFEGILHNFSDKISSIPSARAGLDSDWSDSFRTEAEIGREPSDTAQALRAGIRQRHAQLLGRWKPLERWTFQLFGRFTRLSDRNHRYETEAQASYALKQLPGLEAVYLFTSDNMVERRAEYYSPHRLKQHQFGLEYSATPTPKSWIWARYLPGYGEEQGATSWNLHAATLSGGVHVTERLSFDVSFDWNKTPTYRSSSVRGTFTLRF